MVVERPEESEVRKKEMFSVVTLPVSGISGEGPRNPRLPGGSKGRRPQGGGSETTLTPPPLRTFSVGM